MGILLTVIYVIGVIPRKEAGNTESRYNAWQLSGFGSVHGNVHMCICICWLCAVSTFLNFVAVCVHA